MLRAPGGCPWDIEQTHQSVRANLIEETYEAVEAIDTNNMELLKEELGDVLMQVLFHAQMEAEQGTFTFLPWVTACRKIDCISSACILKCSGNRFCPSYVNWDEIKKKTNPKQHKQRCESLLYCSPYAQL